MVDIVPEHVEACRTSRARRSAGPVEQFRQVVPASMPDEIRGEYDIIVLAVKAHATAGGAGHARAASRARRLCPVRTERPQRARHRARRRRRAHAWAASSISARTGSGPGEILFGNRGAVVVGEIDGSIRERTRQMHRHLSLFEPDAVLTDNIWGYLWGKLAYGAMLFATALTTDSMSENFADPASLHRVRPARPRSDGGRLGARGRTGRIQRLRSSVFRAGRACRRSARLASQRWPNSTGTRPRRIRASTAILPCASARPRSIRRSASIAELGREVGVATPAIACLVALVHDIEEGRRPMSFATFEVLIDTCEAASTTA